jgi:hypothetical protein
MTPRENRENRASLLRAGKALPPPSPKIALGKKEDGSRDGERPTGGMVRTTSSSSSLASSMIDSARPSMERRSSSRSSSTAHQHPIPLSSSTPSIQPPSIIPRQSPASLLRAGLPVPPPSLRRSPPNLLRQHARSQTQTQHRLQFNYRALNTCSSPTSTKYPTQREPLVHP